VGSEYILNSIHCVLLSNLCYRKKTQKEGEAAPEVAEQPIDPEMIDELADDDDLLL
jgi:hypothetical protein